MTATTDHRAELRRAYDHAADVVAGVRTEQLGAPTPCTAFDVAALIDHLVFAAERAAAIGRGEPPSLDDAASVELADAPASLRAAGDDAAASWTDDRLDVPVVMPWGETYLGSALVDMYLVELVTHTWDVARATGQLDRLDEALAADALTAALAVIKPEYRSESGTPFGPEVPAPGGATTSERLAAFMGRAPR